MSLIDDAKDLAKQAGSKVADTARDIKDKATDKASDLVDKAGDALDEAKAKNVTAPRGLLSVCRPSIDL